MKKCSRCKIEKPFTEFHKDRSHSSGLQRYCKECKKRVDVHGGKDSGKFILYYLPKERYVGMTKNFNKRMQKHRKGGKDTTWAFPILKTRKVKLVHLLETMFHMFGFNGFRY